MSDVETLDLTPSTRILPMLGEIRLDLWQCLAELIDNPVDAFLDAYRDGHPVQDPSVRINLPTTNSAMALITIRDNAPGMNVESLNNAVRAGWTSNNPTDNLGLYGMGFNIATARLANKTVIYSARAEDPEWVGVEINFEEMRTQTNFHAPVIRRPKTEPSEHGTILEISNIKPEQREQIVKTPTQSQIKKRLARIYSSMLQADGKPIFFKLYVNNQIIKPRRHCAWGEERVVQTQKFGPISAFMPINTTLAPRYFCSIHLSWLPSGVTECPTCENGMHVRERQRKVTGWIGLKRYLSGRDFGIDFLRNGRKIELDNRDLFQWTSEDGSTETEYPVDDRRNRGRIIGEIHLDHCRVSYTKDRFDRNDPSWEEMVEIVRGRGPILPEKAREQGFEVNNSPLAKLHSTFRRSGPKPAGVAGGWANDLIVKDNDLAEEMAGKFDANDPAYETDEPWWRLVEEEDAKVLAGPSPGPPIGAHPTTSSSSTATSQPGAQPSSGFPSPTNPSGFPIAGTTTATSMSSPQSTRTKILALTREYLEDVSARRFTVTAYSTDSQDDLLSANPWALKANASSEHLFYFDPESEVFQSVTFTPLDALLAELASKVVDSVRATSSSQVSFSSALTSLRLRYAKEYELGETALTNEAVNTIKGLTASLTNNVTQEDARALFNDLPKSQHDFITDKMLTSHVSDPQEVISRGRFLEFAQREYVPQFVSEHPELFFDGKYFSTPYESVSYGNPIATEARKKQILKSTIAWLQDAVWLAETGGAGGAPRDRDKSLRALMSLHLIAREAAAYDES